MRTVELSDKVLRRAVAALIYDLAGRKGLGNEWEQIDASIRREIKQTWARILKETLTAPPPGKRP